MSEWILEQVQSALDSREPVCIRGGGTKDFYGLPATGTALETGTHCGIVSYDPTELVVTARAGTQLSELQSVLAERHQGLAFEPPHFGPRATVGGCVAAGLAGPARQAVGGVRDFVLGIKIIDGRGHTLSFGGTVMKNVAGYDVSRLFCGSMGTLGVLLEVSLKVLPLASSQLTLAFESEEAQAIATMNRLAGMALPLTASAWHEGHLMLRLAGAPAAVEAAQRGLGGIHLAPAAAEHLWQTVREQVHPFFQGETALWRLSLPSGAVPVALPGAQLIEWAGALRWLKTDASAESIRQRAQALGGHATLFRADAQLREKVGVFAPLEPAIAGITRRIKAQFDPHDIFNRGRMYPYAYAAVPALS